MAAIGAERLDRGQQNLAVVATAPTPFDAAAAAQDGTKVEERGEADHEREATRPVNSSLATLKSKWGAALAGLG